MLLAAKPAQQIYGRFLRQKLQVTPAGLKAALKLLPGLWTAKDDFPQYHLRLLARDQ